MGVCNKESGPRANLGFRAAGGGGGATKGVGTGDLSNFSM